MASWSVPSSCLTAVSVASGSDTVSYEISLNLAPNSLQKANKLGLVRASITAERPRGWSPEGDVNAARKAAPRADLSCLNAA